MRRGDFLRGGGLALGAGVLPFTPAGRRSAGAPASGTAGGRVARRAAALFVLLLVGLAAASAADASCQTLLCQQQYRQHDREHEAELRQRLGADPADAEAVRGLLRVLGNKVGRERAIAEYEAAYSWQPAGALDDLERTVADETRRLTERLARLEADDPHAWCGYATGLVDPEARLAALRQRLDEEPDRPELVSCLGRELARQERLEEAVALLRAFLVGHPERSVAATLVGLLAKDEGAIVAVLEDVAARRPEAIDLQTDLLRRYFRPRSSDELRRRGDALARRLLATPLSLADHQSVCRALSQGDDVYRECLHQLLATPFVGEDPEQLASARQSALDSLISAAQHARSWERLEPLLAAVSAADLAATWASVVDFTRGDFCPQFLAAFGRGIEWQEEWHARRLVEALRRCGDEARARELVVAAGLLREDGSDRTAHQVAAEDLRRDPFAPFPPGQHALPARRYLVDAVERAAPGLRAGLERWAREEPQELVPWLVLAGLAERAGDKDEAMASYQAAFAGRPDDLDLQVALGAAALRLGQPEIVLGAARWLRSARTAKARHRAEADYLLGRLARLEGRWEEASDLLAGYFLARLRAEGCVRSRACDRAFVLHLVEAGDRRRLDDYLARRAAAIASFEERRPPPSPWNHCGVPGRPACEDHRALDAASMALDCVSPRALARLEALGQERPDDEALARRTAAFRSLRACTDAELPDPELLFADAELLALSWSLREVD